jgi:hypothetical protein
VAWLSLSLVADSIAARGDVAGEEQVASRDVLASADLMPAVTSEEILDDGTLPCGSGRRRGGSSGGRIDRATREVQTREAGTRGATGDAGLLDSRYGTNPRRWRSIDTAANPRPDLVAGLALCVSFGLRVALGRRAPLEWEAPLEREAGAVPLGRPDLAKGRGLVAGAQYPSLAIPIRA